MSKAHLWITWAQIALEREVESGVAREYGRKGDRERSEALGWETRASLQAITAAAISIDNLAHEISPLLPEPVRPPGTRAGEIREVLNKGFRFGRLNGNGALNALLQDLFDSRNTGLHYLAEWREPVPHPSGTVTDPENVRYSFERAREAIDELLFILGTCIDKPRAETQEWATNMSPAVEDLFTIRGRGPSLGLLTWNRDRTQGESS
jgi:hypothetical protein